MQAIVQNESQGNALARGKSGEYGLYQIQPFNWTPWAAEAGIPGADWRDPQAQTRVARHKMMEYYQKYGSWDLVAVAWRAGESAAQQAQRNGLESTSTAETTNAQLMEYINNYRGHMEAAGQTPGSGWMAAGGAPTFGPDGQPIGGGDAFDPQSLLGSMLDNMSRMVAGGTREPLGGAPVISEVSQTVIDESLIDPPEEELAKLDPAYAAEGDAAPNEAQTSQRRTGTGGGVSFGTGGHTQFTNSTRLQDPQYQEIAQIISDQVIPEITALFPDAKFGQHRALGQRPAGGAKFSDHYWGGALDITDTVENMDAINTWLIDNADRLGLRHTIWQSEYHYDHVHVGWLPPGHEGCILKIGYTPPTQPAAAPTSTTVPAQAATQGRGVAGGAATPEPAPEPVTAPTKPPAGVERGL